MIKSIKKACQICGSSFIGRSDKKFCSDNCRAVYHQSNKDKSSELILEITKQLKAHRNILKSLNPQGKAVVNKNSLVSKGFDFGYYTNLLHTKSGNTYHFCFDYGYMYGDDQKIVLVKMNS